MAKLIVLKPDDSIAYVIDISDSLTVKLTNILEESDNSFLDLVLLKEIKKQTLFVVSKSLREQNTQIDSSQQIQDLAISSIDWFGSLLAVIRIVEKLPNSNSLTIRLLK
ncbi:MAG: hypothetical protein AB4372_00395 [Xenococcus sp. (in: cyanobacteria)]